REDAYVQFARWCVNGDHVRSLPEIRRGAETGQNDGGMPRGFCALCDAPNWLAAESVHASRAAPRSAWGRQFRCHLQSPTKAANEAGCDQARFLSGVHMSKEWACVPKFGRSLAHQESEGATVRPDKVTRQDGALPIRQKGKRKWGIYRPGPQNQQLNHQVNQGATILFGR